MEGFNPRMWIAKFSVSTQIFMTFGQNVMLLKMKLYAQAIKDYLFLVMIYGKQFHNNLHFYYLFLYILQSY